MKLAVISHTAHYKDKNGVIVGWGPTVREINHLLTLFDEIYHIAVFSNEIAPKSSIAYVSDKIHFVPLKKVGGTALRDKWNVIKEIPTVLSKVKNTLKLVDCFQLRTPTGMGAYLIPYLTFFRSKRGWYKYAGNWNQKNPPLSYVIQRWLLKHQKRKVTINGKWGNQPKQCVTFENPCLEDDDRIIGLNFIKQKNILGKINFCFVGSMTENKGVNVLIEAIKKLAPNSKIGTFNFVGDGLNRAIYQEKLKKATVEYKFHGYLSKKELLLVCKKCQFIILPSYSEGFPKVIAEAMNFGCVPIVSDISCIGQYISDKKNGFLLNPINSGNLFKLIELAIHIENKEFQKIIYDNFEKTQLFTFTNYISKIKTLIVTNES